MNRCMIERIHRLKTITVTLKAGLSLRKYRAAKSDGPNDLVFQSVKGWVGSSCMDCSRCDLDFLFISFVE